MNNGEQEIPLNPLQPFQIYVTIQKNEKHAKEFEIKSEFSMN